VGFDWRWATSEKWHHLENEPTHAGTAEIKGYAVLKSGVLDSGSVTETVRTDQRSGA